MSALDIINASLDTGFKTVTTDEIDMLFNELNECSIDKTYINSLEQALGAHTRLTEAYGMLCNSIDQGELSADAYAAYNLAIESASTFSMAVEPVTLSLEAGKKDDMSLLKKAKGRMKSVGKAIWKALTKAIDAVEKFLKRHLTARGRLVGAIKALRSKVNTLDGETFEGTLSEKYPNMFLEGKRLSVLEMSDALSVFAVQSRQVKNLFASVADISAQVIAKAGEDSINKETLYVDTVNALERFLRDISLKSAKESDLRQLKALAKAKGLDSSVLHSTELLPGDYVGYTVHSPLASSVSVGYSKLVNASDDNEPLTILSKTDMLAALDLATNELANRDTMAEDVLTELEVARKQVSKLVEDNEGLSKPDASAIARTYAFVIKATNGVLEEGIKLNTVYLQTVVGYARSSLKAVL